MDASLILETEINNNQAIYNEIKESLESIFLIIVSYSNDDKILIPLRNPISPEYDLIIQVEKREESFFELKVTFNYKIMREMKTLIDENSFLKYYISYGINFQQFYPDIESSILDYLDNLYKSIKLLEVRESISESLRVLRESCARLGEIIEPKLRKTKDGILLIEDYKNYLTDFSDENFQFEVRDARDTFIEGVILNLKSSNENLRFLIQIGDFLVENDFLKIPDMINQTRRNLILDEINKGKKSIYEHIEHLSLEYNGEIQSVSIKFSSPNLEVLKRDQKFKIKKKEYKLESIEPVAFNPIDCCSLIGKFPKSLSERIIISLNSLRSCDFKSKKLTQVPFSEDPGESSCILLGDKKIKLIVLGVSYIQDPLICVRIKCRAIGDSKYLKNGQSFELIYLSLSNSKTRFKLFIRNLDQAKFDDIKKAKDLESVIQYKYYHFIDKSEEQSYLFDSKRGYFKIESLSLEDILPVCEYPFELEYLPQIGGQSIIFITRKDKLKFFLNDRYILFNFYFYEIPNSSIRDVSLKLNKKSQEIINFLKDSTNELDEFGILYDRVFTDEMITKFDSILERSFEKYGAPEDLRQDIIGSLSSGLSQQKFYDSSKKEYFDDKFMIHETQIVPKKRKGEYRLVVKYNFFEMGKEKLVIKYILGHKFFWVDLITDNKFHKNLFRDHFKNVKRIATSEKHGPIDYSCGLPDTKLKSYEIFPERSLSFISIEEIANFIVMLNKWIYNYTKDRDNNSINFNIGKIAIISEHKENGNLERIDTIYISDKFEKLAHFDKSFFKPAVKKRLIEEIFVTKNYNTDQVVYVHFSSKNLGFELILNSKYNGFKIKELQIGEAKRAIELEGTAYYKSFEKINAKIGEKIGDSKATYYSFIKGNKIKLVHFGRDREETVEGIKAHYKMDEAIIETDGGKYLLKVNEEARIFFDGVYARLSEIKKFKGIHPFCLGLSFDLDNLEEIDSALILFLRPNGNLDQICLEKGKDNPKYSIINKSGIIENLLLSEDNLFLRVVLKGEHDFEVSEDKKYNVYKKLQRYDIIAKDLSIFMIYRNELLLEEPTFEEEGEFNINKISVKSFFEDVDIWGIDTTLQGEIEKMIKTLPKLPPIRSIISGKGGGEEKEKGEEIEEGEIKELEETAESFLEQFWNDLSFEQRDYLLKEFVKFISEERRNEEGAKDWQDFSFKRRLIKSIEEIKKVKKEIEKIGEEEIAKEQVEEKIMPIEISELLGEEEIEKLKTEERKIEEEELISEPESKISFLNLKNSFREIWDNTSETSRILYLRDTLNVKPKDSESFGKYKWDDLKYTKIGDEVVKHLLSVVRAGDKGDKNDFMKLIIVIQDTSKADITITRISFKSKARVREILSSLMYSRLFSKDEVVKFIFLASDQSNASIYTALNEDLQHEIVFTREKPLQIVKIYKDGSFSLIESTKSKLICKGLYTEKDSIPEIVLEQTPITPTITVTTIKDVEGLWEHIFSEEDRKLMLENFETFKLYAEIFSKVEWNNPQLSFFREELKRNEDQYLKIINDWLKKKSSDVIPKWRSFISINEDGGALLIIPEPNSREFTDEEHDFYRGLYDKIGIECILIDGKYYKCLGGVQNKEEIMSYIEGFYEYS